MDKKMSLSKLSKYNIEQVIKIQDIAASKFNIIIEDSLESTNDYLLAQLTQNPPLLSHTVVLAEQQTKGKGRHGRNWVSLPGNIYMSMYWPFQGNIEQLYGMSLIVGIAIARVLRANGLDAVRLKWPNDIYWQECKMGGILIETKCKPNVVATVIGIGLNIIDFANDKILQKTVSLQKALQRPINRDRLIAQLLVELERVLTRFSQQGFAVFMDEWKGLDAGISSNTTDMDLFTRIISADQSLSCNDRSWH